MRPIGMYLPILPYGREARYKMNDRLPTDACRQGCQLIAEVENADPVYLIDKKRIVLYQWYNTPTLREVFEVWERLKQ